MHSHTRLEFIIEAVPALIGYVDAAERYRFNNVAYEDWFGRPVTELVGRTLREVLGDAAYAAVAPHVRDALAGRLVTFESEMSYRDGRPRHVRGTYVPDVGEDGRVRGFVVDVNDITDLKRAEAEREQLRRHADELARVSHRLTESLDISEVAERIAESIVPLFQAQSSIVRLLLPDGSLAWTRAPTASQLIGLLGTLTDSRTPTTSEPGASGSPGAPDLDGGPSRTRTLDPAD